MSTPIWRKYALLLLAGLPAWGLCALLAGAGKGWADAACAMLAALWLICAARLRFGRRHAAELILLGGFLTGLAFVIELPYGFSYHDLAAYVPLESGGGDGHLGYVCSIVQNGALPLMNPMEQGYSILYHPPLFHVALACAMKINLLLGLDVQTALECLQVVPWLCACACALVTMDILALLGVKGKGLRAGALTMAFQPMLFLLGATLNNDIPCILCMLLCALFALRWRRSRSMADILRLGASLAAGMAIKLSAALMIPCIALVFVACFWQDRRRWRRYAGQFAAFLGVSVPLAVAWPLYHLLAFGMPLGYVRLPAPTTDVSGYTLAQRFGFPDWYAVRSLFYTAVRKSNHNVWMQTLKTGLFDELILFEEGSLLWYAAYLLLVAFAVLLLVCLALFVRMLVTRGLHGLDKAFLAAMGAMILGSYLRFCVAYPYMCSFNFRYVAPVLCLCAVAVGHYRQSRRSAWAEGLAGLFSAGVLGIYAMYFFVV